MNKLFEVYTQSKTTQDLPALYEIFCNNETGSNFEQGARLCIQKEDENILIELDLPTKDNADDEKTIWLTAYVYHGNIEDYNCDDQIDTIDFNGNLIDVEKSMYDYAISF